jgi:hypothetical protein
MALFEEGPPLALTVQRAVIDPARLRPAEVLALQRAAGNRAVSRLLQPKQQVASGAADDAAWQQAVQRQEDEEEVQAKALVQRRSDGSFEAGPGVEGSLASQKGGGSRLPDDVRDLMESRFGADFGGVRVHTGGEAVQLSKELNAQAFTHGQDIYLGAGRYEPGTAAGQRLLAHELAHVVQQTGLAARDVPAQARIQRVTDSTAEFLRGLLEQMKEPAGGLTTNAAEATRIFEDLQAVLQKGIGVSSKLPLPFDTALEYFGEVHHAGERAPQILREAEELLKSDAKDGEAIRQGQQLVQEMGDLTQRSGLAHIKLISLGRAAREILDKRDEPQPSAEEPVPEVSERSRQTEEMAPLIPPPPKEPALEPPRPKYIDFPEGQVPEPPRPGYIDEPAEDLPPQLPEILEEASEPPQARPRQQIGLLEYARSQRGDKRAKTLGPEEREARARKAKIEKVIALEEEYGYHVASFDRLVEEWKFLRYPGSSAGVGITIKFIFGLAEGVGPASAKAGLDVSLGVSGKVAGGDDYKVRPSLSFKIMASATFQAAWELSAGISYTFTMGETYDSVEHFVAHYMKTLGLFSLKVRSVRLGQLKKMQQDPEVIEAQKALREQAESEEKELVGGSEGYKKLQQLQAQKPGKVEAHKVGIEGGFKIGAGPLSLGISGSASAQYKRFTKQVSAADFQKQNFAQNRRVKAVELLPHDLADRVRKICERDTAAAQGARTDPVLKGHRAQALIDALKMLPDPALESISEALHFGKSFTEATQRRTDAHRAQILKALADSDWDTTEGWKERGRLTTAMGTEPPAGKQDVKELVKTGSYVEVALAGSVATPIGVNITLSGTWSRIRGDANPDNDGNYLNLKLGFDRSMIGHTVVNAALQDTDALAEATQTAEDTVAAWANLEDWIVNDESSDSVIGSVNQLLTGGSLAGMSADKVAIGVLGLGASVEMNLYKSDVSPDRFKYQLQYVRLTRETKSSLETSIPISSTPPISLGIGGERSKSQFIKEFIGTNTLSYVSTAYRGIIKHPEGKKEWSDWVMEHKDGLWRIFRNIATEDTNARKEAEAITGLVPECEEQIKKYEATKLEGWEFKWPYFVQMRTVMEQGFDEEATKRASLKRQDLASFAWRGVEESLQRAKITVNLAGGIELESVQIAKGWWRIGADWWLMRKIKGYSAADVAKEFVHQYRDIGDLFYSGAALKLKFKLPAGKVVRAEAKLPAVMEKAIVEAFYDESKDLAAFPKNVAPELHFAEVLGRARVIEKLSSGAGRERWRKDLETEFVPELWRRLAMEAGLEGKVTEGDV